MAHRFVPNFTSELSNNSKITFLKARVPKYLGLSPTTTLNIVKRFRESREISGKGRKHDVTFEPLDGIV